MPFYNHLATTVTADGLLTVSNATNVPNGAWFNLRLAFNPSSIITGAPVNYTLTVNGAVVELRNTYAARVSSDKLCPRVTYRGYYFVPTDGEDPYVVIDTGCCPCSSQSSAVAAAATNSETGSGS